jgi:hypothetical protein
MNENEILGFDPTQLTVFNANETTKSAGNPLIYKTQPANSISEDGVYRATIKVIYNPFNFKDSVLEQQSYAIHDAKGWLTVVSSLTVNDTKCPIFSAWKKCRYAADDSPLKKQLDYRDDNGNSLFDKRYARYVTVQVLEDKNQPDLVGKYMFWKLPKSIWDMINAKMNPSKESNRAPLPVMDFLFGRAIELEVFPGPDDKNAPERKTRETKYMGEISEEVVSCVNPDGSPLLNDDEQDILDTYVRAMKKVWKSKDAAERTQLIEEIKNDENTKELKKIYNKVLTNIKSVCPDLNKELGYKEWTPEVKARVQAWIDIVLSGNIPAVASDAPKAAENVGTQTTEPTVTATEEDSDDLPF